MLFAGIDVGSTTVKCVILEGKDIIGKEMAPTGYDMVEAWKRAYYSLLKSLGVPSENVERIVSTGYGRDCVEVADKTLTEITCHGAGAHFLYPEIRTLIDIGGQDSKAISLSPSGRVNSFVMNDRCAAGTGRFLEIMARTLGVDMDRFASLALESREPVNISSTCAVFAESEVISMIAQRKKREDIIKGIHNAIASRIFSMAKRITIENPVMLTGGGARNPALKKCLEERMGIEIFVHPLCQFTGAIGAALLAQENPGRRET